MVADGIVNLHNHIFYTSVLVFIFLLYLVCFILYDFFFNYYNFQYRRESFFLLREFKHDTELEIAWTLIPCLILVLIALPSFSFLYIIERIPFVSIFFKTVGHQWFWSYEVGPYEAYFFFDANSSRKILLNNVYHDITNVKTLLTEFFSSKNSASEIGLNLIVNELYSNLNIKNFANTNGFVKKASIYYFCDSYMVDESDLNIGEPRLLTVDVPLVLPKDVFLGLLTASVDVIHSFALPEFGIKLDAVPGRINQFSFLINKKGLFYGQCSELCGVGHAFMPISIYSVENSEYFDIMQMLVNDGLYSSKITYDNTHSKISFTNAVEKLFINNDIIANAEYQEFVPKASLFSMYKSPNPLKFKL